jgi:membrane-bound metal-dependent hydrolase YbcI (DUF457 family)
LLAKGTFPARVSLAAFVISQVLIDCETAHYMLTRQWPIHRWAHTFLVGVPVGLAAGLGFWAFARTLSRRVPLQLLPETEAALLPSMLGGLLGGATHPFLDGIMHSDVRPLLPFSEQNPFLHLVGLGTLHLGCVLAGLIGIAAITARTVARQSRRHRASR